MENIAVPTIDYTFNLEEAIRSLGFQVDEKDDGYCVAHGFDYGDYRSVLIEFYQSYLNNYPVDMKVCYKSENNPYETIFIGVAPTNSNDFYTLFQLLFPSDDFKSRLEQFILDKSVLGTR